MNQDPREILNHSSMSRFQLIAILVCQLINVLDGFDVVIIAYAAPLIADEWSLQATQLGIVFSAGLFGMTVGAFILGPLADIIGRRKTVMFGLLIITIGMLTTSVVQNVNQLIGTRFLTGLGIGALFASLTTLVSEYSSQKRRTFAITVFSLGYPIGATIGGLIARQYIEVAGWHSFFFYGGLISLSFIPIAIFLLPESLDYLLTKQPKNALKQVNMITRHLKTSPIDTLPPKTDTSQVESVKLLFNAQYRRQTMKIWACFFMSLLAAYFLISWIPQILTDAGLPLSQGILGGLLLSAGGGLGMIVLGAISSRFALNKLIGVYFVAGAASMIVFAAIGQSLNGLIVMSVFLGFFSYGSTIGLYALAAQSYPAHARSTGVGWAIGFGRLGSILGPTIAGLMISWGWERMTYFIILSFPLIIGATAALMIKTPHEAQS